jgi:hypothetical protein
MSISSDILFRRCCKLEMQKTIKSCKMPQDRYCEHWIGKKKVYSDCNKWLTKSPKYAKEYFPQGVKEKAYRYCIAYHMRPWTIKMLEQYREDGLVKRGKRGTFGIPQSMIPWFNGQLIEIKAFDMHNQKFPYKKVQDCALQDNIFRLIMTKDDDVAFFAAFPKDCLSSQIPPRIGGNFSFERMSWLKTSLIWTLWRTDWGVHSGLSDKSQEAAILQFNVEFSYLEELVARSQPSPIIIHHPLPKVIYQNDPDRRIKIRDIGIEPIFVKSGRTIHFGLRGSALKDFVGMVNDEGRIKDITGYMQACKSSLNLPPSLWLYKELELYTDIFSI